MSSKDTKLPPYEPEKIEKKWQKKWAEKKVFEVELDPKKEKYYCLEMYPYPSATLHMGHLRNYSIGDCFARYKRMRGFNVLYPMGYDSFGLPAENAAIQHSIDPEKWTDDNITQIKSQQKRIGLSYDWRREVYSHDENYYKWNQWIFLKIFEKDLAYRDNSYVNWCPSCNTVLANEQVINGKCWRCSSIVTQKFLEQWLFKIRNYADELLYKLDEIDWPERVKVMQRNWIGRSEGTDIEFEIADTHEKIRIFTTRADTLYGCTFMVFAPEHPLVEKWVNGTKYEKPFKKFYEEVLQQEKFQRISITVEKKGMFIGKYAINPVNDKKIPVYVGNFVVFEYGAGAIMAVPAHDQRDFEFAKKFDIPIVVVIQPFDYELNVEKMIRAYEGDGSLINSEEFNQLENRMAIKEISKKLENVGKGKETINYKLRDWLISRQRYWGTPIPIIYCEKCGVVPVPYKELPVKLPKDIQFTGSGNPLETSKEFVNCKCPKCKGDARRETDTMDTFVDSSWYFFRFCDPNNTNAIFDTEIIDYFMPVNQYIGGIEHAIMHLLYARFFTKILRDLGLYKHDEPFLKLLTQGMVNKEHPYCPTCRKFLHHGEYKANKCVSCKTPYEMKSAKMSKSLGNVVDPNVLVDKYGADTSRFFILFWANPAKEMEWSDKGVEFTWNFTNKTYNLLLEEPTDFRTKETIDDQFIKFHLHKTIRDVTKSIEALQLRDAAYGLYQFIEKLRNYKNRPVKQEIFKECITKTTLLLSPFMPHFCEEIWEIYGHKNFISLEKWPTFDKQNITPNLEYKWNLLQDLISDVKNILKVIKIEKIRKIQLIVAKNWKYSLFKLISDEFKKGTERKELMKKIMQTDLRQYGKQVNILLNKILKNPNILPPIKLIQTDELDFYKAIEANLANKFSATIEILKEEETSEEKAVQAIPGKPVIIIN
ncbi:MAG: leucine--tRNA ligase [Candidatus Helarchaeota archaeon]|nr:leucine--tRNA ligase [Candidatus Helarchaeota archaeon]